MRLIDADALVKRMKNTWDMQDLYLPVHFMDLVEEEPTVGSWISVKDRLPENEGLYIVYSDKGVESAFYEVWEDKSRWTDDGERYWDIPVTHWMPLPKPPKEESDGNCK